MSGLITERLKNISLFSRCGGPFNGILPVSYKQVKSWEEAQSLCQQVQWGNTTLEFSNRVTRWLSIHAPAEFDDWNEVVEHRKPVFESALGNQLRDYAQANNLVVTVIHATQWNLVLTLIEDWYRVEGMPTLATDIPFPVYEAGHFPCGWTGGEFPNGTLHII